MGVGVGVGEHGTCNEGIRTYIIELPYQIQ